MRLFTTTDEFTIKGIAFPGIPILAYDSMELEKDANDFLLWLSLENARTPSSSTWRAYAESLYDFFSWLEANNFEWKPSEIYYAGQEPSILSIYRNWSMGLKQLGTNLPSLEPSTIHKRLTHLMGFYKWAYSWGRINELSWDAHFIKVPECHPGIYRHTRKTRMSEKDNLRPKIRKKPLKLLTLDQCRQLIDACPNNSLKLMTKLMLQTGLRNEECRTFPRRYVFDPSNMTVRKRIPLDLEPRDMNLKGSKPRRVYITWQLMKELFDYLNFAEGSERHKLYKLSYGFPSLSYFLNKQGRPFDEKSLNNTYRKLWHSLDGKEPALSFIVTPHMLRHTFATFELFAESKRTNLGSALAWIRDRLGHASIVTTSIYVHYIEGLKHTELNQYQEELDRLGT